MTGQAPQPRPQRAGVLVLRVVAGALSAVVGVPFLLLTVQAVNARFAVESDPHGYTLIFGTMLALPLGLVLALVLPLVLPRDRWAAGYGVDGAGYAIVAACLLLSWFTAS